MSAVRFAPVAALVVLALVATPDQLHAQKGGANPANVSTGSPWGVVNDVWVDYDVWDGNLKGMLIHLDFDVDNGLNVPSRAVAYFSYAGGEPLMDFDDSYTSTDGQVSAGTDFTPIYASANFSDLTIFMPYDQLHMAPGSSDLEFYLELYAHRDGSLIAEAGPYAFTIDQQ